MRNDSVSVIVPTCGCDAYFISRIESLCRQTCPPAEVILVNNSLNVALEQKAREATDICGQLTGNSMAVGSVLEPRPADVIWYITDNGRTEQVFDWKPQRSSRKIPEDTFLWLKGHELDFKEIFL